MNKNVITIWVQTETGQRQIDLPQSRSELEQSIAGINTDGDIRIEIDGCVAELDEEKDIRDINSLAEKLEPFSGMEKEQYVALLDAAKCVGIRHMLGIAEHFREFQFVRDIGDNSELGTWYVDNEYPDLDGIIYDNLDFDGVGEQLLHEGDGRITDAGYVTNYEIIMKRTHSGVTLVSEQEQNEQNPVELPDCVKRITAADLRTLPVHEGLVLQGCGGDLKEWVDGINETLTDHPILGSIREELRQRGRVHNHR